MAELIGDAYVRVHLAGEKLRQDIAKDLGLEGQFGEAGEDSAEAFDEGFRRRIRKGRTKEKAIAESMERVVRRARTAGDETGRQWITQFEKSLRANMRNSRVADHMLDDLKHKFLRAGGDFNVYDSFFDKDSKGVSRFVQSLERAERAVGQLHNEVDFGRNRINRWSDAWDRSTVGLFDGLRRSRSESIHVFAGLAGLMLRLLGLPLRIAGAFAEMGAKMAGAFAQAGGGMAGLGAAAGVLGTQLLGAALNLPLLVIGLAAVVVVVGTLTAAFSLLIGVVTALASSLTFALIAAVSALAAVLLPLVAIVGVLGLAFIGMDDKAKKLLKETLKPLGEEFKKLGAAAREGLFSKLPQIVTQLKGVFGGLAPIIKGVGEAVSRMALGWAKAMNTKMFKDWFANVGRWLTGTKGMEGAIEKLGTIAENVLGGMGGLFEAMIPFMTRVLDYLVRTTQEFQNWANSAGGQEAIGAFFERAATSLKSVWGFLKSIGGLMKTVFTAGQASGDTIFDRMATKIREWTQILKDNPDILSKWFEDAKKFATALGDIVTGVGKLVDALDNPVTRAFANSIGLIGKAFGVIAPLIAPILGPVGQLLGLFNSFGSIKMPDFGKMFAGLGNANLWGKFKAGFYDMLRGILEGFQWIARAGAAIKLPGFADAAKQIQAYQDRLKGASDAALSLGKTDATPKVNPQSLTSLMTQLNLTKREAGILKGMVIDPKGSAAALGPLLAKMDLTKAQIQIIKNAVIDPKTGTVNIQNLITMLAAVKNKADLAKAADATPRSDIGRLNSLKDVLTGVAQGADTAKGKDATPQANATSVTPLMAALSGVSGKATEAGGKNATPKVEVPGSLGLLTTGLDGIKTKAGEVSGTPAKVTVTGQGAIDTMFTKISNLGRTLANAIPVTKTFIVSDGGSMQRMTVNANRLGQQLHLIPNKNISVTDGGSLGRMRVAASNLGATLRAMPKTGRISFNFSTLVVARTSARNLTTAVKAIPKTWKTNFTHNFKQGTKEANALTAAIKKIPKTASTTYTITTVEKTVTRAAGGVIMDGPGFRKMASGGFANYRQAYGNSIIGESGREAVVPLDRPLSLVDPAVRALAAFAQGKEGKGDGVVQNIDIDIITPSTDPRAVAKEVLNEVTGALI